MESPETPDGSAARQDRPSGASWRRRLSLRTRLTVSVALSVALVVSALTVAGMGLAEQRLTDDLRETARVTALAVADDVELRPQATEETLASMLHEFMSAAPSLRSISVFRADDAGLSLLASTSSIAVVPASLVQYVFRTGETTREDPAPHETMVAVPVQKGDERDGVVAVGVSLAPVQQLRSAARLIAVFGAGIAIAGITLLIQLLARGMILAPLNQIQSAMRRVGAGDLSARAHVSQQDELGDLAAGLNEMLAELQDLHQSLNRRVAAATDELRQRNEQLVRSYESVLELRETAARAQQLAAVGQTMANVAHQIGTPLNLVSGHVQLLRQEVTDPALQRRLRIIEEQVNRVATSVRRLLDRARPQPERRPVAIGALLARLADATRSRLAASSVRVETAVDSDLPTIVADETQLELALLNLMTNAVDAMPNGGVLSVRTARTLDGVRIEISDTGTGIAPELIARIFDPWVTTKPAGRGTGLGLSIARDVVAGLGGSVSVRSTPGAGSTFTIDLPASVAAAEIT